MIFYANGDGKIVNAVSERVFQGAAGAYRLGLVSPFAESDTVTAVFTLPAGKTCAPVLLRTDFSLYGISDTEGNPFVVRSALLPAPVLQNYGKVTIQFIVRYNGAEGSEAFALEPCIFTVERGVREDIPQEPSDRVYERLLSALAGLNSNVLEGRYGARSLMAWSEDRRYGAGELVFAFLSEGRTCIMKSLVSENAEPPFIEGACNGDYWEEIFNFNALLKAHTASLEQVKASAQIFAAEAKNSANLAAAYAEKLAAFAGMRVEAVEKLPERGREGTLYLLISCAEEGLFALYTYAEGAWLNRGGVNLNLAGTRACSLQLKKEDWEDNRQVYSPEHAETSEIAVYPEDSSAAEYLACGISAKEENGAVVFTAVNAPQTDLGVTLVFSPINGDFYGGYYTKAETDKALSGKQNALSFDEAPLENSANALTSGAVYAALEELRGEIDIAAPQYSAGKGLSMEENTLSVALDASSNAALSVTSNGLKLDLGSYSTTAETDMKLSLAFARIEDAEDAAAGCAERISALEGAEKSYSSEVNISASRWQNLAAVLTAEDAAVLAHVSAESTVSAAPAAGYGADCLQNNVRLSALGTGSVTFAADTAPAEDVSLYLEIANR